jgi:hypothetical protein
MSIPDTDLLYMITNTKVNLSYYDVSEINKAYNCIDGKLSNGSLYNYQTLTLWNMLVDWCKLKSE